MPQLTPPFDTTRAIANVLTGTTADGTSPLLWKVPFTHDPSARMAAADRLEELACELHDVLKPQHTTPLTVKFLTFLCRRGLQRASTIRSISLTTLADAIRDAPDLLTGTTSLNGILRRHEDQARQAAAQLKRVGYASTPPRTIIWQNNDGYRIEQATAMGHLQHDSAVLGHCVGTSTHYWRKIMDQRSRIFTLTHHGQPLVTLELELQTRAIVQMQSKAGAIHAQEPWFAALCTALAYLIRKCAVVKIVGLPLTPEGMILTPHGTYVEPTPFTLPSALAGTYTLPRSATMTDLANAHLNRWVTLDLTHLPQHLLDRLQHTRAPLYSLAPTIALPNLQFAADLLFPEATDVAMPALQGCGDLRLIAATTVSLPSLQTARDIAIHNATQVHLPKLECCEDLVIHRAKQVVLPALCASCDILLCEATEVSVPVLLVSRQILLPVDEHVVLPLLSAAESIELLGAQRVDLPALTSCSILDFCEAKACALPALAYCTDIKLPLARKVVLSTALVPKISERHPNLQLVPSLLPTQ